MTEQQYEDKFNADYLAAQPADVQALMALPTDIPTRVNAARPLLAKGRLIDMAIMIWGWNASLVMLLRSNFGVPYVGSFTPDGTGPGGLQGQAIGGAVPAGTLPTVFVDPTDLDGNLERLHKAYPLPPPPPATPAPSTNPVGMFQFFNQDYPNPLGITPEPGESFKNCPVYGCSMAGQAFSEGEKVTGSDGVSKYRKHVQPGLFGPTHEWYRTA